MRYSCNWQGQNHRNMRQFLVFVRKECYHIFRDRRTLLILFGMPVILIVLFGFAITNEIHHSPIAVLDEAQDTYSRRLTERITSNGYFDLYQNLHSVREIEPLFKKGAVRMVIPADVDSDF